MTYRKIIPLLMVVFDRGSYGQTCERDGDLLPNPENCRKYFKCAQGSPSDQSCPGTLIFDPVLKICNWPSGTTCIRDLLPKSTSTIREKPVISIKENTNLRTRVRGESEDDIVELTAEGAPDQKLREVAIQTLFDT